MGNVTSEKKEVRWHNGRNSKSTGHMKSLGFPQSESNLPIFPHGQPEVADSLTISNMLRAGAIVNFVNNGNN